MYERADHQRGIPVEEEPHISLADVDLHGSLS